MQTFTPCTDTALETTLKTPSEGLEKATEPSFQAIQNILAFSRNLEVSSSKLVTHVEYLKSWSELFFLLKGHLEDRVPFFVLDVMGRILDSSHQG